jgi:hypothetical protein
VNRTRRLVSIGVLFFALCAVNPFAHAAWNGHYYGGYNHYHDNHSNVGVVVGVPFGFPGYYGPYGYPYGYPFGPYYPFPAYYPPAVVTVPAPPTTYVQQGYAQQNSAAASSTPSWYYCDASQAYYPYVKECSSGWQRVAPQPQGN